MAKVQRNLFLVFFGFELEPRNLLLKIILIIIFKKTEHCSTSPWNQVIYVVSALSKSGTFTSGITGTYSDWLSGVFLFLIIFKLIFVEIYPKKFKLWRRKSEGHSGIWVVVIERSDQNKLYKWIKLPRNKNYYLKKKSAESLQSWRSELILFVHILSYICGNTLYVEHNSGCELRPTSQGTLMEKARPTLNWERSSSPTVRGPGSFSCVSALFKISSMSISCIKGRFLSSMYLSLSRI